MTKSLKIKISLSFLLLILMLVLAGVMSILEARKMGESIETVMKNNYQSIETSKTMLDAVERVNNGVLIWMLDDSAKSNRIIQHSNIEMQKAIQDALLNLSETNEDEYVKNVESCYMVFHAAVQEMISSNVSVEQWIQ